MEQKCKCEWCNNKPHKSGKGYCRTHYDQVRKYGNVLDIRTKANPNEIVVKEGYAELILRDNNGEETARALIDIDDIDIVKKYKWRFCSTGYVKSTTLRKTISLHRFIMKPENDLVVDHINHNKLDNRKLNLRVCTREQNMWNKKTKNKGIFKDKRNSLKPYRVQFQVSSKRLPTKYFTTYEEALEYREQLELEHYGEYRYSS